MRLLFLCNTLYQIVAASCIRNMFPDYEAHLILSDHSVGHKKIFESMREKHLIFNKVFYVETKYLYEEDAKCDKKTLFSKLKSDEEFKKIINLQDEYDFFICANAEPFSTRMVNYLRRRNSKTIINWFEDGLTAYNFDKVYFPSFKKKIKAIAKKIMIGIYDVTSCVSKYYVFLPDKMEWKPDADVVKILPMNKKISKELAVLFSYENSSDHYEEKYIFFEDGMRDWSDDYDLQLAEKIAENVGKDNMIVKIHPRDPHNRFAKRGFKTNKDMSIPWEIVATNIDIENKVLITMYSQAVITPEILTGKNGRVLALGYLEKKPVEGAFEHLSYLDRQFFSKEKEIYFVPKTEEDMITDLMDISK